MASTVSSLQGSQGRALATEVIEQLSARGLAFSAVNYELWLAYLLGQTPDLTQAIEAAAHPLTQDICDTLFERYCAGTRLSLQVAETGDSLARELVDIVAGLRSAGDQTRAYGATLSAAAALDAGETDPALFRGLVRDLAAATRLMQAENQKLSTQMQQSAEHVDALQSALAHVKVEAFTDGLTGAANRRAFEAALKRNLADAHRDGSPFSLVLCDIDHFKRINDNFGHPVGDQVIRFVARVLSATSPAGALVARYGGEEFAILLPGVSCADAYALAEQARITIRAQRISKRSSGQMIGAVTVSFGVTQCKSGDDGAALVARADRLLYAAKSQGRDQVVGELPAQAAA